MDRISYDQRDGSVQELMSAVNEWLRLAVDRDIRGRAARVSLVVGTLLTLINQGDIVVAGELNVVVVAKIILTFCVPYCVSTYAGVEALRHKPAPTAE